MSPEAVRLDKRLVELFDCSRGQARQYIENGWVKVDGVVVEQPQTPVTTEQVELLVTNPLEAASSGLLGVKQVASKSLPGISILKLYFEADTQLQEDRWRVAQHLASVHLPAGVGPMIAAILAMLAGSAAEVWQVRRTGGRA